MCVRARARFVVVLCGWSVLRGVWFLFLFCYCVVVGVGLFWGGFFWGGGGVLCCILKAKREQ